MTYTLKKLSGFQRKKKLRWFTLSSGRKSSWSRPARCIQLWSTATPILSLKEKMNNKQTNETQEMRIINGVKCHGEIQQSTVIVWAGRWAAVDSLLRKVMSEEWDWAEISVLERNGGMKIWRWAHLKVSEQQVQRPWGGTKLNVFPELKDPWKGARVVERRAETQWFHGKPTTLGCCEGGSEYRSPAGISILLIGVFSQKPISWRWTPDVNNEDWKLLLHAESSLVTSVFP